MVIMSITEWDLLKVLSEQPGSHAMYGEAIYKFVQMPFLLFSFLYIHHTGSDTQAGKEATGQNPGTYCGQLSHFR